MEPFGFFPFSARKKNKRIVSIGRGELCGVGYSGRGWDCSGRE